MPKTTPRPPRLPSWEHGWSPDTSRAPGTRRLWLAGGLAAATVVSCLTAISMDRPATDESSAPVRSEVPTDAGPGLLSFASPSPSTTASPHGSSGPTPATPSATAPGAPAPDGGARATASPSVPSAPLSPSSRPAGSGAAHGGSSGASKGSPVRRSVRSVNYPDRYWHVRGGLVKLDPVTSPADRRAATFRLVDGLADRSCYSFATADGGYLRHRSFVLRAERDDGSALYRKDATFCPRPAARSGAVVLESVNYPGRFLRHQDFQLRLDPYQDSDLYRADSAFRLQDGLS
ncbi:AbfB domain-containing protein [Streptomyces shenzhenensis]|uniref:Alpha-L-arabinofuranosidase n=1 Tax=Streptomyces shenzhenensis TaxID=943815 RepID=A0A3M0I1F7_9ACTN|nr:AbfB domain-containing protein [Streptomyces shenzhenensis]RMB82002.1 alpha-L-arabinofuranosidase [Streptomyces shenzhenensis]